MFAVPGWSLGKLKSQEEQQPSSARKDSKKRKRKDREDKQAKRRNTDGQDATADHTAPRPIHEDKGLEPDSEAISSHGGSGVAQETSVATERSLATAKSSRDKIRRKADTGQPQKTKKQPHVEANGVVTNGGGTAAPIVVNDKPAPSIKLTPLQAAMRQKLVSARFRHLNQTLYTSPSNSAKTLFDSNPTFFEEYHSGFRQQVSTWPENPVDAFVDDLSSRGAIAQKDTTAPESNQQLAPLPRTKGTCTVADLGCGDASLAHKLAKVQRKHNLRVQSYDLGKSNDMVTRADIANLPLDDGAVNIAVFCLALMGTNWIDFVEEAWRILHWKGELWIAEIKSRFAVPKRARVEHSVGKRRKTAAKGAEPSADDALDNLDSIDGAGGKPQTDVSAFVNVLRRRGFALRSGGVNMSNKMFVKLHFVKALAPSHGKYAGQERASKSGQKRASDPEVEGPTIEEESAVLKPCLYKVR